VADYDNHLAQMLLVGNSAAIAWGLELPRATHPELGAV
jgi:hypothetical protein